MLLNNVIVVCVCFLGGRGRHKAWEIDQHLCACALWDSALYMHMRDCAHTLYNRPQHPVFLPFFSSAQREPQSAPPPALSWPTTYSCEERRRAERDICSLRECPNYSWSFNHSGFGLAGICGVSHKCAPATLVNGSFINSCFVFCTFQIITKQ